MARRSTDKPKAKKQAVVVIHGMGEQLPLATLRSFVKAVWESDERLGDPALSPTKHPRNEWWIKPDDRAGLQELRRITTPPMGGEPGRAWFEVSRNGRRTDFYEFYWADLMQGTTWQQVSAWLRGLLLRVPSSVPADVQIVWIVLWIITLVAAMLATIKGLGLSFNATVLNPCGEPSHLWTAPLCGAFSSIYEFFGLIWTWGTSATFVLLGLALLLYAMSRYVGPELSRLNLRNLPAVVAAMVGLAGMLVLLLPILAKLYQAGAVGFVVLAGLALLLNGFLVSYFGDVARYVEAKPANVERRKAVRERGLALLTGLHESGDYDRIVIVSHSLGTIVAYDLINMLWNRLGPGHRNQSSEQVRNTLTKLDNYVSAFASGTAETVFDLDTYRSLQRELSAALASVRFERDGNGVVRSSPWLISDLVTVGSPLTHAEFLLARDEAGLRALIAERILPVCPPVLESVRNERGDWDRPSFMFLHSDENKTYAHHATCFAAVRWTNIHDPAPRFLFLRGDVISGRVLPHFGDKIVVVGGEHGDRPLNTEHSSGEPYPTMVGIKDIAVQIHRSRRWFPRFFTHTEYWNWHGKPGDVPPDHIRHLREAVALDELPYQQVQQKDYRSQETPGDAGLNA